MQNCKKFNVLHGNDCRKYKKIFFMMPPCIEKNVSGRQLENPIKNTVCWKR